MSFDIQGWIEITYVDTGEQEDDVWVSVINISRLVDVADVVSERLFGLSKRYVSNNDKHLAFFANRGVPTNPSAHVAAEVQAAKEHEQRYGPGEYGGYTHATWQEVKGALANIDAEELARSDWNTAFALVRNLENDWRWRDYPNRIRFVVWFCW